MMWMMLQVEKPDDFVVATNKPPDLGKSGTGRGWGRTWNAHRRLAAMVARLLVFLVVCEEP